MTSTAMVFDTSSVPSPGGSTEFSLHLWEPTKNRGLIPNFHGRTSKDEGLRREFLVGARRMGYELVDLDDLEEIARMKAMKPPRYPIQPQQLWIVDALNADYDTFAVEIMRRASKTTTIFCWALGRCECRPGYQATFSAQTGVKGSARLREWKNRLDAINPPDDLDLPPWLRGRPRVSKRRQQSIALFGDDIMPEAEELTSGRGFKVMLGEVSKGIYFDNGSTFLVLKPTADAYRGEGADLSWLDEAQELDPEEGADLLAGIVPLQDTKDESAIVISGTAGEARVGPFWEVVEKLRAGDPNMGGLDYCAPETTPWDVIEDEDAAMGLLEQLHPGVGTLTNMDKMRKNWHKLTRPKWAREYLSLWPETAGARAIPSTLWEKALAKNRPPIPARVAFGLSIKPGGSVAAICAAWRDSRGVAYIEVVEHRSGTHWIPDISQALSRQYRTSTIAYDDIAEGKATAAELGRMSPKPRLRVQTYYETAAGCVQLLREMDRENLRHFGQIGMETAVAIATKREPRGSAERGIWLWNVSNPTDDITCLDAATRALRNWDQHFTGKSTGTRPIMAA